MLRLFLSSTAALIGLALIPFAAGAGGPTAGVIQGGTGVVAPKAGVRYIALGSGIETMLAAVRIRDGRVLRYGALVGRWGIPLVTGDGGTGGLDARESTLVLGDATPPTSSLRKQTRFLIASTKTLRVLRTVELRGDFAFDALSPDARTLYLIQHVSGNDLTRYRVRAYDLRRGRLLAGVIADKRQQSWVMSGWAVSRATSPGGRWVYTLYSQNGNYPFVHALDTVSRTAVCIGIPWKWTDAEGIARARLRLSADGRTLMVVDVRSSRAQSEVNTRTFRVTQGR